MSVAVEDGVILAARVGANPLLHDGGISRTGESNRVIRPLEGDGGRGGNVGTAAERERESSCDRVLIFRKGECL